MRQVEWLDRLEGELDNLRLALEWSSFTRRQDGLKLASALFWFWHIRGHGAEGIDWLERLLEAVTSAHAGQDEEPGQRLNRAKALIAAGFLTRAQDELEKSKTYLTESLAILRALGVAGRESLASVLLNLPGFVP
jgi:hypothetical protein